MNPSTALACVVVDELVHGGVTDVVLAPGSRSAPLAFALHAADAAGRLRLHVRIDERTAGFLALGLAKASGTPTPVVTTSGTAAVNLHPAVVEAAYSGVPLLAVTADRPAEMRGIGANQTIDQERLFGRFVAAYAEIAAPVDATGEVPGWRGSVAGALAVARRSGPVQLNLAFREPLVPDIPAHDREGSWSPPSQDPSRSPTTAAQGAAGEDVRLDPGPRTVLVAGDGAGDDARRLAESAGWPLLAEPTSGARGGPNALATYRYLLDAVADEIERVVVVGRPTLSRPVTRLLARTDVDLVLVSTGNSWSQLQRPHARTAARVVPAPADGPADPWLARWLAADAAGRAAVAAVLADEPSGPSVARTVCAAVEPDGLLVIGSSAPVRDADLADPWTKPPLVLANRGAAGIDGTVSTAVGAALAHRGPAYALLGDLTFLHDATGLVLGTDEPRPDLTIVVNNDDGGGIFTTLEQGATEHAAVFERVFGTPHGVDLAALCRATGTRHTLVATLGELRDALVPPAGISVVEVPTDRAARRELDHRLRTAVTTAARG